MNIRKMTVVSSTVSRDIQQTWTLGLTDPARVPYVVTNRAQVPQDGRVKKSILDSKNRAILK